MVAQHEFYFNGMDLIGHIMRAESEISDGTRLKFFRMAVKEEHHGRPIKVTRRVGNVTCELETTLWIEGQQRVEVRDGERWIVAGTLTTIAVPTSLVAKGITVELW